MANYVHTDAVVVIAGVTFTSKTKNVAIPIEAATVDTTTMGSNGWVENIGGLKSFTLDLELLQDFAASSVDVTLYDKVGTSVTFDIRPATGTVSATNPKFTGSAILTAYAPISGAVGDLAMVRVSLQGTGAPTRGTS